jgi:hypothetical protein
VLCGVCGGESQRSLEFDYKLTHYRREFLCQEDGPRSASMAAWALVRASADIAAALAAALTAALRAAADATALSEALPGDAFLCAYLAGARRMPVAGGRVRVLALLVILRKTALILFLCHCFSLLC